MVLFVVLLSIVVCFALFHYVCVSFVRFFFQIVLLWSIKAFFSITKQDFSHYTKQNKSTSSFDEADEAVLMIACAFHRQNDTEQVARLGRKNMQIMDRLAKMQAHKRNSIARIKHSYGR